MSLNKNESRRDFIKKLGKIAGVSLAAAPFVAGNLCFSEEELGGIEKDLEKIRIKNGQQDGDMFTCTCSSNCGTNYAYIGGCECSASCGTNYAKYGCECSSSCGTNYGRLGCECSSTCGSNYSQG